MEVGAGEVRALAGLLDEVLGQLRAGQEGDLAVAGEVGGRSQGAGSFQAGCLVLSSREVAARRLLSGPVGAGTSEGYAFAWGWAEVGTGMGREVGGEGQLPEMCLLDYGTRRMQRRLDSVS